ncbi:hypothetical protein FHS85_000969 [Rhodoligotrophos appendicifer]|uniref:DUF4286 family protein n=1 Tax=Rhodoligotrophos appendicifer TaxID=987056 RepID=UPI0011810A83|nr:DUF4286 family protein [Rhodoligotrophos appendicifer]
MVATSPKGQAILFSEMTPDASFEAKFNRWYDEEHIPLRMGCSGFASAQRYKARDDGSYLAVYEMEDLGVLGRDDYAAVKNEPSDETKWMLANVTGFTRYLAAETSCFTQEGTDPKTALDAPVIHSVWFNVPDSERAEFDDWYESEHIPLLMKSPDWLMVRRLSVSEGTPDPFTHLSIHYLAREEALNSPERQAARTTAWRDRLAARDWFKARYAVFRWLGERQHGRG